jgi:hypothetical protein
LRSDDGVLRIGLLALKDCDHVEPYTTQHNLKLFSLLGPRGQPLRLGAKLKGVEAIAIVGTDIRKTSYARKALSLGKHVLVDFPPGLECNELLRLQELAARNDLCFYSPNLLKAKAGVHELKNMASDTSSKLLSLTLNYNITGMTNQTEKSMKLAQILDLAEWIAGSQCVEIRGEKSCQTPFATAQVVLISHENGVKTLLNIRSTHVMKIPAFWIDGIFENSIVHLSPLAQSILVEPVSNTSVTRVNWGASILEQALKEFQIMVKEGPRDCHLENLQRTVALAREVR